MALITLSSHFSSFKTLLSNLLLMPEASVVEYLEQLISKIIKVKLPTSAKKSEDLKPVALKDNKLEDVVIEASRLEFKTVDELYVFNNIPVLTQLISSFYLIEIRRLIRIR